LIRRRFVSALGALGFVGGLPACGGSEPKQLAVASHIWVGYEPMFLAEREGWIDQKQVRLVETVAAPDSIQALAEGRVQAAALTLDETFKARELGQKLSVVLVFNISAGADMLLTRAPLKSLSELRGKRLAVEQSSVGELLLSEILQKAGLATQDVTLVPLSVERHIEGWKQNVFDAVITYEPVATELLNLGASRLFDTRQLPDTVVDVLAVRTDALVTHGTAIRHLIACHFKALDHLTRNPQDTAYRMSRHLKVSAEQVLPAFKGLVLPNAVSNHRLLAGEQPTLLLTARKLSEVMSRSGLLKQPDSLDGLIRADFLPSGSLG
jgi:NitT/TauT family transport system substrate-binding protein